MKLICAPMATLSHPAFRILIEKFGGCDEYYTEMINAASLLNKGQFEKYYIDPSPVPEKIVWQLTGKSSEPMIKAAAFLCTLPGIGIDLNMGCSAPEIANSGAGIAWMLKDREETKALLSGVRETIDRHNASSGEKKRFSVKCRLGADDFTDESFFLFIKLLSDSGVEQVAVHPRTKRQKYSQRPLYQYAEAVGKEYGKSISIVVNGDIKDKESLENVSNLCPSVSSFMIGRAAVQKPWIFKYLRGSEPFTVDFYELGELYVQSVLEYQPPEFWKTRLQRFFTYFSANFSFAHYAQTQLLNAENPEDSLKRLSEYFQKVPEDRIKEIR